MAPPTNIDGSGIKEVSIDGAQVQEITVDGNVVFSAGPNLPAEITDHYTMSEGGGSVIGNSIGSVDIDASEPSFVSGPDFLDGFATDYSGNDIATSQSAFSANGSQITAFCWFQLDAVPSGFLINTVDSNNNGWRVDTEKSKVRHGHRKDGLGFTEVFRLGDNGGNLTAGKRYLFAVAMNGDNASGFLFDSNGQVGSTSGSGTRPTQFNSELLLGDRDDRDIPLDGQIDAVALARGTELSQSKITQYFNETV
jgi:hypothetical protein